MELYEQHLYTLIFIPIVYRFANLSGCTFNNNVYLECSTNNPLRGRSAEELTPTAV